MNEIIIKKKEIMETAGYQQPPFPKYTSSLINLINRWAGGTANSVVGQMSDLAMECPYKDYKKWKEWYLEKHPEAIENAVKLIMMKLAEVKEQFIKIDDDIVKAWVADLVIDKSFWGLKIQEAIMKKLEKLSGKKCRLASKEEESKGFDGFIGNEPVQIKPSTYKIASNVKTEQLRTKVVYYEKTDNGDYKVDITSIYHSVKED